MIKGKYVATLVIDVRIEEGQPGMYPFEKIKENFVGKLDKELVAILSDELGEECSIGLNRQYVDIYQTEE